ncbi:hypothetical protein M9H77_16373 [Catharanthus roseus]|uniref:Uncharacterized protein n=1 Tax=Catharanthus roseus TaxID=4058 RepID=A0ACC0B1K9_CATRO|nr:hypothetical protein M9H77_16373 [Catharanthus roseus]
MPGLDPTQHFSRTQIPLNDVSGPGLQLGAQFFEQLAGFVPVDSSYSGAKYGATACGNFSSDVGVGSLRIHSSEGNKDEHEDDGGHEDGHDDDGGHDDDDDDGSDDDGDDHELVPVVEASSSGHRLAPSKRKGLTGSFMSVMSKIAGSRQKRPEKSRPPTNPMQRKKSKNDSWEQTGPRSFAGCIWRGQDRGILKSRSHYVPLTGWTPNTMTADEVRWTPYISDEITDIWVSTYHGIIASFDSISGSGRHASNQ